MYFAIIDVVKYVNTPINATEPYSVPKGENSSPKYLEIIHDENDDGPIPMNPYEIPLPPLDETEIVQSGSPTFSESNSNNKSTDFDSIKTDTNKGRKVKRRTISSSSTVSETSVLCPPRKKEQLNVQPDDIDLSNTKTNEIPTVVHPKPKNYSENTEKLLMPQQSNDISKRKLKQMYANMNVETAIQNYDGITSM